jgi:hypothetical protein
VDYETTLRYAHLAPDYLKAVVRNGSLGVEMLVSGQTSSSNRDLNRAQETSTEAGSVQTH